MGSCVLYVSESMHNHKLYSVLQEVQGSLAGAEKDKEGMFARMRLSDAVSSGTAEQEAYPPSAAGNAGSQAPPTNQAWSHPRKVEAKQTGKSAVWQSP